MCHFHNKISYICINMYIAYITKIYKCFSKGYLFFYRKVITISTKKNNTVVINSIYIRGSL